jgi:hypothetical protein
MGIKVKDLDQVEAWKGGAILPPGRHTVTITKAEEGTSSGNYPQVELEFSSDQGSIRDWIVFTENTLGKARQLLDAAGIAPEGGEWDFPTERLPGKRLSILVQEQPDRNDPTKTRTKVVSYEDLSQATPGSSDPFAGVSGSNDDDVPF